MAASSAPISSVPSPSSVFLRDNDETTSFTSSSLEDLDAVQHQFGLKHIELFNQEIRERMVSERRILYQNGRFSQPYYSAMVKTNTALERAYACRKMFNFPASCLFSTPHHIFTIRRSWYEECSPRVPTSPSFRPARAASPPLTVKPKPVEKQEKPSRKRKGYRSPRHYFRYRYSFVEEEETTPSPSSPVLCSQEETSSDGEEIYLTLTQKYPHPSPKNEERFIHGNSGF